MSGGVMIEVPEAGADGWGEEFDLPSGRKARVRPMTGRMLIQSQKLAGRDASAIESSCATVAVAAKVDGRTLRYEEAQDMVSGDILVISNRVDAASFLDVALRLFQQRSQPS